MLWGAGRGTSEAVECCMDPEVEPGLHGVILVVHPEGNEHTGNESFNTIVRNRYIGLHNYR